MSAHCALQPNQKARWAGTLGWRSVGSCSSTRRVLFQHQVVVGDSPVAARCVDDAVQVDRPDEAVRSGVEDPVGAFGTREEDESRSTGLGVKDAVPDDAGRHDAEEHRFVRKARLRRA